MDCLERFRTRMKADGSVSAAALEAIDTEVSELIDREVAEAKAAAPPGEADLYSNVYIQY